MMGSNVESDINCILYEEMLLMDWVIIYQLKVNISLVTMLPCFNQQSKSSIALCDVIQTGLKSRL